MILSVSRRTDIPNYYSHWFFNRLAEGWLLVGNPHNPRQLSRIDLFPRLVDFIVFWTKNPGPMLPHLAELGDIPFCFQFTLTGYGPELEPGLPDKPALLRTFQALSRQIGRERLIWRYDPILFTEHYTPEWHLRTFSAMAAALEGCTDQAVISFVDLYAVTRRNLRPFHPVEPAEEVLTRLAAALAGVARAHGMEMAACAEPLDLSPFGVAPGRCIDPERIQRIAGRRLRAKKDPGQRPGCGCAESIDVGAYHTCPNGCKYCYANHTPLTVRTAAARYDPRSPLLCGQVTPQDRITQRPMRSLWDDQQRLF